MEQHSFPPYIINVQQMVQTLINQHGSKLTPKSIGKKWIYKFLSQHPKLDSRLARNYNTQRAKNKNPKIINE